MKDQMQYGAKRHECLPVLPADLGTFKPLGLILAASSQHSPECRNCPRTRLSYYLSLIGAEHGAIACTGELQKRSDGSIHQPGHGLAPSPGGFPVASHFNSIQTVPYPQERLSTGHSFGRWMSTEKAAMNRREQRRTLAQEVVELRRYLRRRYRNDPGLLGRMMSQLRYSVSVRSEDFEARPKPTRVAQNLQKKLAITSYVLNDVTAGPHRVPAVLQAKVSNSTSERSNAISSEK